MVYHIDEYTIRLEGEQIFKKYKTNFKTSKGDDEVFNLDYQYEDTQIYKCYGGLHWQYVFRRARLRL